jgi:hypothetical protein
VPGGSAAIRRLLGLDTKRPDETFFLDLHETLLFDADPKASWSEVKQRKRVVTFIEDLAEWRQDFGNSADFAIAQWKMAKSALEWLGFKVRGEGRSLTTERLTDAKSIRRQSFLDVLGTRTELFQARLRAGEKVTIKVNDEPAPLPFGLRAWQETLDEPGLSAPKAFLYFTKNVRASRMLVALHGLDSDTRDEVRWLIQEKLSKDEKAKALGWRILYDNVLDAFCRYPEALTLRSGQFVLPGGKDAEPIWADIAGVPPSDRLAFLSALFATDSGKLAYVVDVLQRLPDRMGRELVLGRTGGGQQAIKRFRRLYRAIEHSGESFELTRRDPYDFAHLAAFLRLSDEGNLQVLGADLDGSDFPRSEGELSEILAGSVQSPVSPEESLRRLFRHGAGGAAQRRFLVVSNLLGNHPGLQDRGLAVLLFRGFDRFLPAYGVLEDLSFDEPRLAREYLFALDHLDRRGGSRDVEVGSGLFQAAVELLDQLWRAGSLVDAETQKLFSDLLDLRLFSQESLTPALGEKDFFAWLSGRLLATLRVSEDRLIEARRRDQTQREANRREAPRNQEAKIETAPAEDKGKAANEALLASERLFWLLDPGLSNADFVGPLRPRYIEKQEELARNIATAAGRTEASAEDELLASKRVNEELEAERRRARQVLPKERRPSPPVSATDASTVTNPSESHSEFQLASIPEQSQNADDLITRALAGPPAPTVLRWNGERYLFDPTTDDASKRRAFRQRQMLTSLADLEKLHRERDALAAAIAKGDLSAAKSATSALVADLRLGQKVQADADERIQKERQRAWEAATDILKISKPTKLAAISARLASIDTVIAEGDLESLLGHVYASAVDSNDVSSQDPAFVRRHSFRRVAPGTTTETTFASTELVVDKTSGTARLRGSLFGLRDALGLLHANQIGYARGSYVGNDEIRSGLAGPVRRTSPARLDDDALRFVAASCRATEEFAAAAEALDEKERASLWAEVARDLVPRSRRGLVSAIGGEMSPGALAQYLSPSDLYRIGKRLSLGEVLLRIPAPPSATVAKEAFDRLRKRLGEDGAGERLAEFGPRAFTYAGRFHLADIDMPPYEWTTQYRTPQMFSDRLYDLKISVARRVEEGGLPAAILPLVLPGALDEMMAGLNIAFAYDWSSIVRAAQAFSRADLDRLLDRAVGAGRLVHFSPASEPSATK